MDFVQNTCVRMKYLHMCTRYYVPLYIINQDQYFAFWLQNATRGIAWNSQNRGIADVTPTLLPYKMRITYTIGTERVIKSTGQRSTVRFPRARTRDSKRGLSGTCNIWTYTGGSNLFGIFRVLLTVESTLRSAPSHGQYNVYNYILLHSEQRVYSPKPRRQ